MATLTISLPANLQAWVDARVGQGDYADAAQYVSDLVDRDRARAEDIARVRVLIQEGLDSGIVNAEPEDVLREMMAGLPDD
jgi:antitoxin ParD1/3/4